MKLNPRNINLFLLSKLPSAWFCGVRLIKIDNQICQTRVKHRWINQNPFKSMYFAVQAMAAELSTGAIVMREIQSSKTKISMLVAAQKSEFHKKATGKITFTCQDVKLVQNQIENAKTSKDGQKFWMNSIAKNEDGIIISEFQFLWTIKCKS